MKPILKVAKCPHTKQSVVMQYSPGDTDGIPDWLCLHGDTRKEDKDAVRKFKEKENKKKV